MLSVKANDKVDPSKRLSKCHIKAILERIVQYSARANKVYAARIQKQLRKTNCRDKHEVNLTFKIICKAQ